MFNFLRLLQLSLLASAWWHVTKADEEAGLWAQRRAGNVHFGGASSFNDQVASGLDSSSSISSSSFRYPRQLPPSVQADQDEQYHPEAQDDSYYYQSDQPTPSTYSSGSFPISNLGRGSSSSAGNTFHLSSASSGGFGASKPTWSQSAHRPGAGGKRKYTSGSSDTAPGTRVNFGAMLARSKRSAPGPYYYPQPQTPTYSGGNYGGGNGDNPGYARNGGYGGNPGYGGNGGGYGNGGYEDEECQYHTLLNGDSEMILHKLLPFRMVGRTILRHCIKPPPHPDDPRYKTLLRGNNKSSFGNVRVNMKF